jgi:hypothetical protein
MPDSDELAALGQKLTAALTSAYSSTGSNAALVFLPGGIPVPTDIVQSGIVNAAQMGTFLETNFDYPFQISLSECVVNGRDVSFGSTSNIYMFAASSARPLGSPSDDSWQRVTTEIAQAQRALNTTLSQTGLACEPDDWVLPSNTGYWSMFDSTQTEPAPVSTTTSGSAEPKPPVFNNRLWVMRSVATAQTMEIAKVPSPASPPPAPPPTPPQRMMATRIAARPEFLATGDIAAREGLIIRHPIDYPPHSPPPPPPPAPPPPPVPTSIRVSLQHQCVTLAYLSGGVPWWNGIFLADTGWYIPGMNRGALLPVPKKTAASTDLVYGLPVAMIVVQGLTISGHWSGPPNSIASIGPFSLQGAIPQQGGDGSITLTRPGMQVIALLCNALPVLPPVDSPPPRSTTTTSTGTSQSTTDTSAAPGTTPTSGTTSTGTTSTGTTGATPSTGTTGASSGGTLPPSTAPGTTSTSSTGTTGASGSAPSTTTPSGSSATTQPSGTSTTSAGDPGSSPASTGQPAPAGAASTGSASTPAAGSAQPTSPPTTPGSTTPSS